MRESYPAIDADAISCFLRLAVIGSEFLSRLDKVLAQFELTHGRWVTLLLLRRRRVHRGLPSELAQEQGVTRATMSGLIRQLERQGLVTREGDPDDGRQTTIILTADGLELIAQILPHYYALINELLAPLGKGEKTDLKAQLELLLSGIR